MKWNVLEEVLFCCFSFLRFFFFRVTMTDHKDEPKKGPKDEPKKGPKKDAKPEMVRTKPSLSSDTPQKRAHDARRSPSSAPKNADDNNATNPTVDANAVRGGHRKEGGDRDDRPEGARSRPHHRQERHPRALQRGQERIRVCSPSPSRKLFVRLLTALPSSRSSISSIPKGIKFLRAHYNTLKDIWAQLEGENQVLLADVISVLAMSIGDSSDNDSLKFRLVGSKGSIETWGHEYIRSGLVHHQQKKKKKKKSFHPTSLKTTHLTHSLTHACSVSFLDVLISKSGISRTRSSTSLASDRQRKSPSMI